jgi:hypothetical protein
MSERQLLASILCVLATANNMACDPATLVAASKCLWAGMSDRQLLASIALVLCEGGGTGGAGGLTFTDDSGEPALDGSVTTQGYHDTDSDIYYINTAWPDIDNPAWKPI